MDISGVNLIVSNHQVDNAFSNEGEAYIFNSTTGALVRTFNNPAPGANEDFGGSVSISSNYALISAPNDDVGGINIGSA